MLKNYSLTAIFVSLLGSSTALAQGVVVSGSSSTPDASAMLDVQATDKGFLAPRMTQAQRVAILSPANGLLVFQTDGTTGFYANTGTSGAPTWTFVGRELPVGGTAGQVLSKVDGTDYNVQWTTPLTGSGNNGYLSKWTATGSLVNSQIQDNGTGLSVNYPIQSISQFFVYRQQQTTSGDGQSTVMGYRDRNNQNDGSSYAQIGSNTGVTGHSFWGDRYSFAVGGWNYNDFDRCGGVIGAEINGNYFGILGYKSSATVTFGVYGSNAFGSGSGYLQSSEAAGVGGGFFGSLVGAASSGNVIGQLNSGELFASYNRGNVYTVGKQIELAPTGESVTPVYAVSGTEAMIYAKGKVALKDGTAFVAFDKAFTALAGELPVVTVTPNGPCKGVYIESVTEKGFTIREQERGQSAVSISWIAVANRKADQAGDAATRMVTAPEFDRNIQEVLQSDSNNETTPKGMWWDGTTLRFGKLPETLTKTARPEQK